MGVKDIFLFIDFVDFFFVIWKIKFKIWIKKFSIEFFVFSLYLVKRKIRYW